MDKKEENQKGKNTADQKPAESAADDKSKDKKDQQEENDGEVVEKFNEPDYAAIAPEGEFDLYNVSEIASI